MICRPSILAGDKHQRQNDQLIEMDTSGCASALAVHASELSVDDILKQTEAIKAGAAEENRDGKWGVFVWVLLSPRQRACSSTPQERLAPPSCSLACKPYGWW